ncbi:MAG: rhodanese-like domain-containing protein [Chitinophagales bacterium]|jgi:rhodanese-related sulfurtransferase|nr:rhodanese-like domain-containing protein [Chitinophagales bacterium]HQD12496.1 rhodanese-like domain-containing protein [Chitinophagales bacterium]
MRTFLLSIVLLLTITSCNSQTKQEAQKSKEMKTIIVDVRSQEEWEYDGHADCSVNYPLDQFASHIEELKQYDKVVLVCRSGNRASYAQHLLEQQGYRNAENKGPWQTVKCN